MQKKTNPKSNKNPQISAMIPTSGQPMRTTKIPPKNKQVALILCHWKKKPTVRCIPITRTNPVININ